MLLALGPVGGHVGTAIKVGSAGPVSSSTVVVGGAAAEVTGTCGAGEELDANGTTAAVDEITAGTTEDEIPGAAGDEASAGVVGNTTTAADDEGPTTGGTSAGVVDEIGTTVEGSTGTGISGGEIVANGPAALGVVDSAFSFNADVIAVFVEVKEDFIMLVVPTGITMPDA